MAFFTGTTSNTALDQPHYRDLLVRHVAASTSNHVSALAVNAGGTGYTTGDILEVRHASEPGGVANTMPCRFTVTAAAGAVTGIQNILSAGAFSARAVTATVSAGGANYAVGDILQVQGGTYTRRAKFRVATLSGSAVATVTLWEDGGAYTAFPSNPAATTKVGPAAGTGSGCTLTLSTQAIIGTTGAASTVITGGGNNAATFDLTLTATGWTAVRDNNNFSVNSITDEMEVVLQGTVSGGDEPFCGYRTYTQGSNPNIRYGWILFGMDTYNDLLAITAQANVGPGVDTTNGNVFLLMFDVAETYWFRITGRAALFGRKAQGGALLTYQTGTHGLLNQYGTASESPYPFYISGTSGVANTAPDATGSVVTGPTELYYSGTTLCPAFFRHPGTGVWTRVQNANLSLGTYTSTQVLYPLGKPNRPTSSSQNNDLIGDDGTQGPDTYQWYESPDGTIQVSRPDGGAANVLIMPTLTGNETLLVPCTVISSPNTNDNETDATPRGEIDGLFWISGTKSDGNVMTAEDVLTDGSVRHTVLTNGGRVERYSFFAIEES